MDNSHDLEIKIAKILRFGIILSGGLIFLAWIFDFKINRDIFFNFQTYDQIPLKDLLLIYFRDKNWAKLISYFGLALLIILPLIRVLVCAFLFFKQKEFMIMTLALAVFVLLLSSMSLGIAL